MPHRHQYRVRCISPHTNFHVYKNYQTFSKDSWTFDWLLADRCLRHVAAEFIDPENDEFNPTTSFSVLQPISR